MYSQTNITYTNDNIQLSRIIDSKLITILFNADILAIKLIPYFNMNDENFKKFLR